MDLCVETDSEGNFKVAATMGMLVQLDIEYEEHEFVAIKTEVQELNDAGIWVEGGKSYTGFDFKDIGKGTSTE